MRKLSFTMWTVLILCTVFINLSSTALSQEFSWTNDFNQAANQDIDAFKKKLADRFSKKQNQVNEIFKGGRSASDAYMAFKLSEMSGKPAPDVVSAYDKNKSKGWGALAKELGIKPGSKEFHALKNKEDLYHGKYSESFEDRKKKDKKNGKNKTDKDKKNKLKGSKNQKELNNSSEKENKKKWWNFFD